MNRFFTREQAVSECRLPAHLQAELFQAVQPFEQGGMGDPLYLESQLDRWLADRFGAAEGASGQPPSSGQESFITTREVAVLLRCSYSEARERLLDGRIRAIRDSRWLRTRRQWVEEYVAGKTIKPGGDEPGVYTVPKPPRRRVGHVKLKRGGIGEQFLREREEAAKKNKGQ
jgi:excisionase family DNA binding protein